MRDTIILAEGSSTSVFAIVVVVFCGVAVVAAAVVGGVWAANLRLRSMRHAHGNQSRIDFLRYNVFDGRPELHLSPPQWQVDVPTLRSVAAERGYSEAPPAYAGYLTFRASQPTAQPAQQPAAAAAPQDFPHQQPTAAVPQQVRSGGVRPLLWIASSVAVVVLSCAAGAMVLAATEHSLAASILGVFGILSLKLLPFALRLLPKSTQLRILAREFNGSAHVSVLVHWYGFDDSFIVQQAAAHGYLYLRQSWIRAYGRFITFARNDH